MDIVLLSNGRQFSIIEKPHRSGWMRDWGLLDLVAGADPIDVLVQTIVEQMIPIASARVGGTNPNRAAMVDRRVVVPGHFPVDGQPQLPW
jgi:hypothetical protein